MHGEGHGRQHHAEKRQAAEQGRHQLPVGELAADEISGDQADAEHQQDRRHGGLGKAGDLGEHRRDIGERGKHADPAEHCHQQSEQHLRTRQRGKVGAPVAGSRRPPAASRGHERRDHGHGGDADCCDGPEGGAPAIGLAEPGAERDAQNVGHGQAGEHDGDRRRLAVGGYEAGRDHRADAEERAVREGGQDARRHQRRVARRHGTGEIAEREDQHERQQDRLARPAGGERRHQRGANRRRRARSPRSACRRRRSRRRDHRRPR